jgi:excinuclease ABC subunit C
MKQKDLDRYRLPDAPGVYFFLGLRKEILYIGRATSLSERVRSYFRRDVLEARGAKIVKLMEEVRSLDHRKTDSVLEAMLLEADLIKKFKPTYNTSDKDDKSFNCVVITDEDFPRVLLVRKKNLDADFLSRKNATHQELHPQLRSVFGPFPEGGKLQTALKLIRKIFPFRDTCVPLSRKPCFNRYLGLCPGVCTGEISSSEYGTMVKNIERLFEGKKSSIVRSLTADMKLYAKAEEFEKAQRAKQMLFALQHIADVALIAETKHTTSDAKMRVEAFDVAHTAGKETVGVMSVLVGGTPEKSAYRMFKIKGATAGDDLGALTEVLERRFNHSEWGWPDLVVIDGGRMQLAAARRVLARSAPSVPLVSVVKNERHQPSHLLGDSTSRARLGKEILLANSEAHRFAVSFHRRRRDRILKL